MNRKILASMLIVGVVAAVAGGSTFALFNDTETSDTNTFEAGALDLQIDWVESYNGEVVENQTFTDNPGSIFDIQDVKPGDVGEANVSLHVFDNPAFVNMTMTQTGAAENSCTEPEAEVDDSCEGEGELGEHLYFTIYDNDDNMVFNGTAEELDQQSINLGLVDNSTTEWVRIEWHVPRETGNVIQTDSKHFRFDFSAVQARHNGLEEGAEEAQSRADADLNASAEADAEAEADEDDSEAEADDDEQVDEGNQTDADNGDVACEDFDSQEEAQDYFEDNDADQLDADNDGIACEGVDY